MQRHQLRRKQIDDKIEVFQRESTRHKRFHRRMRHRNDGIKSCINAFVGMQGSV
jgi:hypothetical protein